MKPVIIGTSENSTQVSLDVLKFADTRCLIQGNSGGGKSYLLRVIAEQTIGQIQTVIFDSEGEFSTLREIHPDLLLISGDGEIKPNVKAAGLLARKLCELNVSAVIGIDDMPIDAQRKFVRLFLESLMSAPRAIWHPMLLMIDEAHKFAPEKSAGESEATQAVIALMSQGRKRGFGGILASQRLSKLHKDSAAECNNVMIGRTWLDVDQQRASGMLGLTKGDKSSLQYMEPGKFYGFGPALNLSGVVTFQTAKARTTHPEAGTRHKVATPAASNAVNQIVQALSDLPEQAEQEARTLREAQARIQALERELKAKPKPQADHKAIEQAIAQANAQFQKTFEHREAQWQALCAELRQRLAQIGHLAGMSKLTEPAPQPKIQKPIPKVTASTTPQPVKRRSADEYVLRQVLPKGERSILTVLAQYPNGRTKIQVAILTGYAHNGGGFSNYVSSLRSRGLLEGGTENLRITEDGLSALGDYEPLPTGDQLIEYWLNRLGKCERACLEVLCSEYPSGLCKEALANLTGYEASGGGFNNALSKLRTLELIHVHGSKEMKASDAFFEE